MSRELSIVVNRRMINAISQNIAYAEMGIGLGAVFSSEY